MFVLEEIPFHRASIQGAERSALDRVLDSGWLTSGPWVERFERRVAERLGVDHAIALSSCTAALHLSLLANDIGPGDEVIVPTMTFASTAEVVAQVGATPVLVDVEPRTLSIDIDAVQAALTANTRAIMPMHYGGRPADMSALLALQRRRSELLIIEDAAHAFGAEHALGPIGSIGDLTCFSFYANKPITTGEGGMVTTNNSEVADRIRRLSRHGINRSSIDRHRAASGSGSYDIVELGFKLNMSDMSAALGVAQLERCENMAEQRRTLARYYDQVLADHPLVTRLPLSDSESAAHLYVVDLGDADRRNRARVDLADRSIGTSVHYRPLHCHSFYRDRYGTRPDDFPVSFRKSKSVLSLPLFPDMGANEVETVCRALVRSVEAAR